MELFKKLFGKKERTLVNGELFSDDYRDASMIASLLDLCFEHGDYKEKNVAVVVAKEQPRGALPFSLRFGSKEELRDKCYAFTHLHRLDAFKEILKTINFGSDIEGLSPDGIKELADIAKDLNSGPLRYMQIDRLARDVLFDLKTSYRTSRHVEL